MIRHLFPKPMRRFLRLLEHNFKQESGVVEASKHTFLKRGMLDYSKAKILMGVSAYEELDHLKSCHREPETVRWLEEYLKPSEVLYDIGANVGAFSFVGWASSKKSATIYAFEPSFSTFASLGRNIQLNNAGGNIFPFQVALADATKTFYFSYASIASGQALHNLNEESVGTGNFEQSILGWRLDDFVEQFKIKPPHHIKIDVDGGELRVVKGAERTLAGPQLRSLLIEIDEGLGGTSEIKERIARAGFVLLKRCPRKRPNTFNYIFVRGINLFQTKSPREET